MIGRNFLFIALLLLTSLSLNAQSNYRSDELIIKFSDLSGLTQNVVFLNQIQASPTAALADGLTFKFQIGGGFPKTIYEAGTGTYHTFFNIIDILEHTLGKAKVDGGSLNYEIEIPPLNDGGLLPSSSGLLSLSNCSNYPGVFPANVGGTANIKVGIIDTGVDTPAINANFGNIVTQVIDLTDSDAGGADTDSHGTRVTSIVADVLTHMGATNASIIMIKAFRNGTGLLFNTLRGLEALKNENVKVINMSFGFTPDPADLHSEDLFADFLHLLQQNDILAVVSSGNEGLNLNNNDYFPSTIAGTNNLISVGSSDCSGDLSSFSNYGDNIVHLLAPGENITTVYPSGEWGHSTGTSFSTPLVSGLAAIYASQQTGSYSLDKVKCKVVSSAYTDERLVNNTSSGGILDYDNSVCPGYYLLSQPEIPVSTNTIQGIELMPNPFVDQLQLQINSSSTGRTTFELFNTTGQRLLSQTIEVQKGFNQINIKTSSQWPAGVYFAKIMVEGQSQIVTQQLIKR
ncbi:MAG: S8 family peptidase [Saprospiraceae bacterium]|nr:S8 family peptidase [Saprospiraceae bacterium]